MNTTSLQDKATKWKSGGKRTPGSVVARPQETVPYARMPMTDERKAKFLQHLAKFGSVQKAAEMTDGNRNTRRTFMATMAKDISFGKACEDSLVAYSERVAEVLREEFFQGVLTPIVNKSGIVTDKDGNEVWIRKRDPKIVLALSKKHDWNLREVKTNLNIDATNPNAENPDDPRVYIASSDLMRLPQDQVETLLPILKRIHQNRRETLLDITPKRIEAEDAEYTIEAPESVDPDNPYGI